MRHGVLAAPRCRPRMAIFADPVQATRDLTSSLAASTEVRATIAVAASLLLSTGAVASWRGFYPFGRFTNRLLPLCVLSNGQVPTNNAPKQQQSGRLL